MVEVESDFKGHLVLTPIGRFANLFQFFSVARSLTICFHSAPGIGTFRCAIALSIHYWKKAMAPKQARGQHCHFSVSDPQLFLQSPSALNTCLPHSR